MSEVSAKHTSLVIDGDRFDATVWNSNAVGPSLVPYFGWFTTNSFSEIRRPAQRFAAGGYQGPRRVINIYHVRPASTLKERAEYDKAVLDELGIHELDIAGISLGGLQAVVAGGVMGNRVRQIVAVSPIDRLLVRLGRHMPEFSERAWKVVIEGLRDEGDEDMRFYRGKLPRNPSQLLRMGKMLAPALRTGLSDSIGELGDNTRLTVVATEGDFLSPGPDMQRLVDIRNARVPGMSETVVVPGSQHTWSGERSREMYTLIEWALSDTPQGLPND